MNKLRLQQLAGIKSLFEQDNSDAYMQWEDEMKEQFIEQHPHVTDEPEELEIEDDGQVYHRESNQRWPANTVTPFGDWQADQQGQQTDAAHERGKEKQMMGNEQQEKAGSLGVVAFKNRMQKEVEKALKHIGPDSTSDQVYQALKGIPQTAADNWSNFKEYD